MSRPPGALSPFRQSAKLQTIGGQLAEVVVALRQVGSCPSRIARRALATFRKPAAWAAFLLVTLLAFSASVSGQPLNPDPPPPMLDLIRQGNRPGAAQLWDNISDGSSRNEVAGQMAQAITGSAPGGGALADFDSLINLITSTVEPETWELNGTGQGAIQQFPQGVFVDADGVLGRIQEQPAHLLKTSLRRALDPADDSPDESPTLRKVSLPRLERAWLRQVLAGEEIPDQMYRLAGLQRVEYVTICESTGDLILAGPAVDSGPALSLDAWLNVFHNATRGQCRFGCSIDPHADNIAQAQKFIQQSAKAPIPRGHRDRWGQQLRDMLGRQEITVHGLDPTSHAARIIVAADYHMKLIGMGIEPGGPNVPSYLSMVDLGPNGQPPPMDVLRWWFTLKYDRVETDTDRTTFRLVGSAAQVLCENEFLNRQGHRVHTGNAEPKNLEFASRFTQHLDELAVSYPVYRQLQGLFDLAVAAALIREHGLAERVGWQPLAMVLSAGPISQGAAVATEVETVVKIRELNSRVFVTGVSGGVEVDPRQLVSRHVVPGVEYELRVAREASRPAQPYAEDRRWWWDH